LRFAMVAARRVAVAIAEQIFEPFFADERVSFDIKEDIARGRWRQKAKTRSRDNIEQFVAQSAGLTRFDLNTRLLPRLNVAGDRTPTRLPRQGHGPCRTRLGRRDAIGAQLVRL